MQTVEKKHNIEGIVATVILHALVLLLFYFFMLRTPNPPLVPTMGGGGVEVSLGDPNAGTNNMDNMLPVETVTPDELNQNEEAPEQPEETPQETSEETITPTESEDAVAINAHESKDKKTEEKKTDNKSSESTQNKSTEKPRTMSKSTASASSQSSSASGADKNTKGDPGNTNGKTQDGRYYGDNGKGGGKGGGVGPGNGLAIGPGYGDWKIDGEAIPKDNSNEFGSIEFIMVVNEDGKVINVIDDKSYGISPKVVSLYRNQLLKLSVEPPSGKDIVPGTRIPVTYTINSKN